MDYFRLADNATATLSMSAMCSRQLKTAKSLVWMDKPLVEEHLVYKC